jgi:hypothetical protein
LSKPIYYTMAAGALLALAACVSSVKPEQVITQVTPGMAQIDVVKRVGPPDREYVYAGQNCFQYALGNYSSVPFAVYFDGQNHVTTTAQGRCAGLLR